jgi:phage tail protein
MAMMWLGAFPFTLDTIAYENLTHSIEYKWATQDRLGHPVAKRMGIGGPGLQYIGPDTETLELDGAIFPSFKSEFAGTLVLRVMAGSGSPWPLIQEEGLVFGFFIIKSINNTQTLFYADGSPRKVDFKMSLQRYHEIDLLPYRLV